MHLVQEYIMRSLTKYGYLMIYVYNNNILIDIAIERNTIWFS